MASDKGAKGHHGSHGGKPAKEHHGSTAEETAALNETFKTFSEEYHKDDPENRRRERVKFLVEVGVAIGVAFNIALTAGLLVAGAMQAKYSGDQVKASQDQVRVMDDQEKRQLRAYVGITQRGIENFGMPNQVLKTMRKNYGATPAYDLFMDLPHVDVLRWNAQFPPALCWPAPVNLANTLTLFPSQELRFEIRWQSLSKEQIDLVRVGGDYRLIYWGTIHYKDAFGETRCTRYCWSFKGENMAENDNDYCVQHNDAY